jgi:hypothetical protein
MSSSPSLTRASSSVFLLLVSGFWILASLPSPAIVDTNNNTLSDIWEKQYNNKGCCEVDAIAETSSAPFS